MVIDGLGEGKTKGPTSMCDDNAQGHGRSLLCFALQSLELFQAPNRGTATLPRTMQDTAAIHGRHSSVTLGCERSGVSFFFLVLGLGLALLASLLPVKATVS
jgi:hypothetical protein